MLHVTIPARMLLLATLQEQQRDGSHVLRVAREPGRLKEFVGKVVDGDELFELDGRAVLSIDQELTLGLDGATIDAKEGRLQLWSDGGS